MPKKKGLKRRSVRLKPGTKPSVNIVPEKKGKGATYTRTEDYKYFQGHLVPQVARQLEKTTVICWYNSHTLSLPVCAVQKFWKEQSFCKRCSLFQGDAHARHLKELIEAWEIDDPEEE